MTERALVVENEPDVLSVFVHHLGRLGFDCDTSPTAEEALAMCANRPYDLAVVDLMLPGMGGSELIHRLYAERLAPPPAIVVTSILDAGELERVGADAILQKPFRARAVAKAVAEARRGAEERRTS